MAISFKNLSTNEVLAVSNISRLENGQYKFQVRGKGCGARFLNRNVCLLHVEDVADGTILEVAPGWEPVDEPKARKPRAKKTTKVAAAEPIVTEPTTAPTAAEPQEPNVSDPVVAEKVLSGASVQGIDPEVLRKELVGKYGEMGNDMFSAALKLANMIRPKAVINTEDVERIVDERIANHEPLAINNTLTVVSPKGTTTISGKVCENFDIYCNLVSLKKPLYMYGPAGSGKSYTAKQIAEALKLDYYETSQALFAHELKGYGDAQGRFVETAFYRAFANGGIFFLDEVDASAPEALVVLNNAIANGRFDFPVIGNVKAHEDFRVVAAGNTRMTGATLEYTARQMQDTSFKNRFFFEVVTYDPQIMLEMAGGDASIVAFGADLRKAARTTGITQLLSYRQAKDLATLQEACRGNDAHLLRGSVLQEKEVDECVNLYERLTDKSNRWAKAMKACIEEMRNEEIW